MCPTHRWGLRDARRTHPKDGVGRERVQSAEHQPGWDGFEAYHVAYQTDDIDRTLGAVRDAGIDLIDQTPRVGIRGSRVAFLNPRSTGGVLTELVEPVH